MLALSVQSPRRRTYQGKLQLVQDDGPVPARMNTSPALFFSHHKCATTWLGELLARHCSRQGLKFSFTQLSGSGPTEEAGLDAFFFTNSLYEFCQVHCDKWLNQHPQPALHIIRNPLDLVVSAYYSHLNTHRVDRWPALAQQRAVLRKLDKRAGMIATWTFLERADFHMGVVGPLFSMRRWDYGDPRIKTLRMEDLVNDDQLARNELQVRLAGDAADVINELTFEKISGGRQKGTIDNQHHFRSGKSDQWLEELDVSLANAIYETYRSLINDYYPDVKAKLDAHQG